MLVIQWIFNIGLYTVGKFRNFDESIFCRSRLNVATDGARANIVSLREVDIEGTLIITEGYQ